MHATMSVAHAVRGGFCRACKVQYRLYYSKIPSIPPSQYRHMYFVASRQLNTTDSDARGMGEPATKPQPCQPDAAVQRYRNICHSPIVATEPYRVRIVLRSMAW